MARVLCVGQAVQDFVFAVPRLPTRGEKYRATKFEAVGGGPAATAAVAIARLGGAAQLAARVGGDSIGALIVEELQRYGVDCRYVRRFASCTSSVSSVLIDSAGERLIVNHLDAGLPDEPDWLPEPRAVAADAVLADTRWPHGAASLLGRARAAGLPAVLDADRPVPRDPALIELASHVAFSAEGLEELTGTADPERALLDVARAITAWCCVTVGADGVICAAGGVARRHPAFAVTAVDTLGAGDVWHGAFALALAEGQGEAAAVRFASAAAALKVQRFGGRCGAPGRHELETFLAQFRESA